jgi:hypothetical protein
MLAWKYKIDTFGNKQIVIELVQQMIKTN